MVSIIVFAAAIFISNVLERKNIKCRGNMDGLGGKFKEKREMDEI
jgi:hypothetical protein